MEDKWNKKIILCVRKSELGLKPDFRLNTLVCQPVFLSLLASLSTDSLRILY